jgi:hypothetical protein
MLKNSYFDFYQQFDRDKLRNLFKFLSILGFVAWFIFYMVTTPQNSNFVTSNLWNNDTTETTSITFHNSQIYIINNLTFNLEIECFCANCNKYTFCNNWAGLTSCEMVSQIPFDEIWYLTRDLFQINALINSVFGVTVTLLSVNNNQVRDLSSTPYVLGKYQVKQCSLIVEQSCYLTQLDGTIYDTLQFTCQSVLPFITTPLNSIISTLYRNTSLLLNLCYDGFDYFNNNLNYVKGVNKSLVKENLAFSWSIISLILVGIGVLMFTLNSILFKRESHKVREASHSVQSVTLVKINSPSNIIEQTMVENKTESNVSN